jgi:uncharacterized membrane protein
MKKELLKSVSTLLLTGLVVVAQQSLAGDSRESRSYTGAGPGWTIDINNKSHAVNFTTSEGTVSYKYPKLGPTVRDKGAKVIYFAHARGQQLNIQVMDASCTDAADKSYDTTVAIVLEGQGYWGCGSYN